MSDGTQIEHTWESQIPWPSGWHLPYPPGEAILPLAPPVYIAPEELTLRGRDPEDAGTNLLDGSVQGIEEHLSTQAIADITPYVAKCALYFSYTVASADRET